MTRLLAVDTSGPHTLWCGVEKRAAVDPVLIEGRNRHDTVLADGVAAWLDSHAWRASLDAVAVVNGPGGFTGLRVGVAFAAGLATALALKVVPVETLRLLAARVDDGLVWAITRSAGGLVRGQIVRCGEHFQPIGDHCEFDPRGTIPLPPGGEPLLPIGEGYDLAPQRFNFALGSRLRTGVRLRSLPDALALAAARAFADRLAVTPLDLDVIYGADFRPTPKSGA